MVRLIDRRHRQRRLAVIPALVIAVGTFVASSVTVLAADRQVVAAGPLSARAPHQVLTRTGCRVFPDNNVWNTPIDGLPVNAKSVTWLASMAASTTNLHPDYGPSGDPRRPYGIPWTVVRRAANFTRISFHYQSESDRRPYPLTAATPIEGGSDRHALMVDPYRSSTSAPCTLFETYATVFRPRGRSTAGSGAVWNLNSNSLRPAGYTSADAAGLPILPGLVNFDQVASGTMDHAIRFTVACTQQSFLWPARHQAGQATVSCPPMGARFRLNASFSLTPSQCSAFCQTVVTTMKTYGMILADNGSNWYFQGTADTRWTSSAMDQLKLIPANQFVAVDESCLMVSPNSGEAVQPGSAAFLARCAR